MQATRGETLADAFLADMDEQDDPVVEPEDNPAPEIEKKPVSLLGKRKEREEKGAKSEAVPVAENLSEIAVLLKSDKLKELLARIAEFQSKAEEDASKFGRVGSVEETAEYDLVVSATNMTTEIADEQSRVHKFIRDHYAKKFSELESLVLNPVEYARTVKRIGNETDLTLVDLTDILPAATIMVVSVTGSTTTGIALPDETMNKVNEACDELLSLEEARIRILQYVESRMQFIAPNLSAMVGSSIAAKLMGVAGGLTALSKLPATTVQLLGAKKTTLSGFSTAAKSHGGFVNECDIVVGAPRHLQVKAKRIISTKCTLAARVDSFHQFPNGQTGRRLREEIEKKLEKMQEPPPAKAPKPLPAPDDKPKKRRGGKRARKLKEMYAMTEVRKQANRMAFGPAAEDTYGNSGKDWGMIGKAGSGKVRVTAENKNILKKKPKLPGLSGTKTTGLTSGLSTSLSFTPVQGMEFEDPLVAERRLREANEKYFSSTSGFMKVKKDK